MSYAGFVLVGGRSSRMGRDKAMLPYGGATLVEHVAAAVRAAAGSVRLVGDPDRYRSLPYPVVADRYPGCGPAAGLHAALAATEADWNLVVACDMPALNPEFLRGLIGRAEASGADCLVPVSTGGRLEPLCAVYHRACLAAVENALRAGIRKLTDVLAGLRVAAPVMAEAACFDNLNTPEDWSRWAEVSP